jgi:hypothetical protein
MTIRLENQWRAKLARLPETGMGFQLVDIRLRSGRWLESLYVHNGQECETNERFDPHEVVDVRLHRDEQDSQPMVAAV